MFYSNEILSFDNGGRYGIIWLAASFGNSGRFLKKLGRKRIMAADIPEYCAIVLNPEAAMALRLKASLLVGIVRIHSLQWKFFLRDVEGLRSSFIPRFNSPMRRLPQESREPVQNTIEHAVLPGTLLPEVVVQQLSSIINESHRAVGGNDYLMEQARKRDSISSRASFLSDNFQSFGFSDEAGGPAELDLAEFSSLDCNIAAPIPFPAGVSHALNSVARARNPTARLHFDAAIELSEEQYERLQADANTLAHKKQLQLKRADCLLQLEKETLLMFDSHGSQSKTFNLHAKSNIEHELGAGFDGDYASDDSSLRRSVEYRRQLDSNPRATPLRPSVLDQWSSPLSRISSTRASVDRWSSPNNFPPPRRTPSISPVPFGAAEQLDAKLIKSSNPNSSLYFHEMLPHSPNKAQVASLFTRLLRLAHDNILKVHQPVAYGRIAVVQL